MQCDICRTEWTSSSGNILTKCSGKKMCPDCFNKWQKGLLKIDNQGRPYHVLNHSDTEKQLNLESNGII